MTKTTLWQREWDKAEISQQINDAYTAQNHKDNFLHNVQGSSLNNSQVKWQPYQHLNINTQKG